MRPFVYQAVDSAAAAVQAGLAGGAGRAPTDAPAQFIAGGTTLLDLMKLDVMRPQRLVDINALARERLDSVEVTPTGLRLGALVRMAQAADHPAVCATTRSSRSRWPSRPARNCATWPAWAAMCCSAPAAAISAMCTGPSATSATPVRAAPRATA